MRVQVWRLCLALPLLASGARAGGRPKAVEQLQAISQKVDAEGDVDKKAYDALGCFCETHLKAEEQVISDMRSDLQSLGYDIQSQTAAGSRLEAELGSHEEELESSTSSLNTAQAIRDKESAQFTEDEQTQVQQLGSLDDALNALGKNRRSSALLQATIRSAANLRAHSKATKGMLLQLNGKLRGHQSPDMIYGVVDQMKRTFKEDLDDSRVREARDAEQHDGLVSAKSQQIKALRGQVIAKKQRSATLKQTLLRQHKNQERSGVLLDAHIALQGPLKSLCEGGEQGVTQRQEERQQESIAIADALTELSGAQLLGVASRAGSHQIGGADAMCNAAREVVEGPWPKASGKDTWRNRAMAACDTAKGGGATSLSDAADLSEALEEDMKVALQATEDEQTECLNDMQDAKRKSDDIKKDSDVHEEVIASDKETAESQIASIEAQGSGALDAKAKLSEVLGSMRGVLQRMQQDSVAAQTIFEKAAASAPDAAKPKINGAAAHAEKLRNLAAADPAASGDAEQKVAEQLDAVAKAASKALIPLKLLRADAEEAAVDAHEAKESALPEGPKCDAVGLADRGRKIKEYLGELGKAAEALAWNSLR